MTAASHHRNPQLLLIELNEFDPEYLAEVARSLKLKHLEQVLKYRHATTMTDDRVEHQGLDPWVQWVGIHSGCPTSVHGIRRLGATTGQNAPQIWNVLAQRGHTWGVWGAMNAPLGNREGCRFFMPDPWAFDEQAFPDYLNNLLALPRYVSKNYLDLDYRNVFLNCLRLARFFAPPGHWGILARFGMKALASIGSGGANVHTFTTLLDYLSVIMFIRLRDKLQPDFSLIFLNNIAHLQHHFWLPGPAPLPAMRLGLELTDAMFGLLLGNRRRGEGLLLMNGLRQKNVAGAGFYVYRQKNPQKAVEALGVVGGHVEPCMTNDANILFSTEADTDSGFKVLEQCKLSDGHQAFYVERTDPNRLFYQCALDHKIEMETLIFGASGLSLRFYDLFEVVAERTGAHVPEGDIFSDGIEVPPSIQNYELFGHVTRFFGVVGNGAGHTRELAEAGYS